MRWQAGHEEVEHAPEADENQSLTWHTDHIAFLRSDPSLIECMDELMCAYVRTCVVCAFVCVCV